MRERASQSLPNEVTGTNLARSLKAMLPIGEHAV